MKVYIENRVKPSREQSEITTVTVPACTFCVSLFDLPRSRRVNVIFALTGPSCRIRFHALGTSQNALQRDDNCQPHNGLLETRIVSVSKTQMQKRPPQQRRRSGKSLITLAISNILLPIALLVFASGFFPYKPFLPGLADFEQLDAMGAGDGSGVQAEAQFDKIVFMVVDALRRWVYLPAEQEMGYY